jgi:hypothetical protein
MCRECGHLQRSNPAMAEDMAAGVGDCCGEKIVQKTWDAKAAIVK